MALKAADMITLVRDRIAEKIPGKSSKICPVMFWKNAERRFARPAHMGRQLEMSCAHITDGTLSAVYFYQVPSTSLKFRT